MLRDKSVIPKRRIKSSELKNFTRSFFVNIAMFGFLLALSMPLLCVFPFCVLFDEPSFKEIDFHYRKM